MHMWMMYYNTHMDILHTHTHTESEKKHKKRGRQGTSRQRVRAGEQLSLDYPHQIFHNSATITWGLVLLSELWFLWPNYVELLWEIFTHGHKSPSSTTTLSNPPAVHSVYPRVCSAEWEKSPEPLTGNRAEELLLKLGKLKRAHRDAGRKEKTTCHPKPRLWEALIWSWHRDLLLANCCHLWSHVSPAKLMGPRTQNSLTQSSMHWFLPIIMPCMRETRYWPISYTGLQLQA